MDEYQVPLLAPSRVDDGDSRKRADRRTLAAPVGACAGQCRRRQRCRAISRPGACTQRRHGGESGDDRPAFASLVTWTVWLAKTIEIMVGKRRRTRGACDILAQREPRRRKRVRAARRNAGRRRQFVAPPSPNCSSRPAPSIATGIKERDRVAARTHRSRHRTPAIARHRRAGDHRFDRAVRRPVRHRLGHHEQLHRHFEGADHQSRGGRARHRRGAARDRVRACRRHSGRGDLQRVRAVRSRGYRGLLGDASAEVLRLVEPRPRPPARRRAPASSPTRPSGTSSAAE